MGSQLHVRFFACGCRMQDKGQNVERGVPAVVMRTMWLTLHAPRNDISTMKRHVSSSPAPQHLHVLQCGVGGLDCLVSFLQRLAALLLASVSHTHQPLPHPHARPCFTHVHSSPAWLNQVAWCQHMGEGWWWRCGSVVVALLLQHASQILVGVDSIAHMLHDCLELLLAFLHV